MMDNFADEVSIAEGSDSSFGFRKDPKEKDDIKTRRHETTRNAKKIGNFKHHIMNMMYRDPLYISSEEIPDDKEYYWVAESCMDKPDHGRVIEMERRGWKPVPASRHPDRKLSQDFGRGHTNGDYIYYKGLVLYERDKSLCEYERQVVQEAVDKVESNMPAVQGGGPANWRRAALGQVASYGQHRTSPRAFGW